MELKEAIEKLANESVEYADIAENVLEGKGKVAEDCKEYVDAIEVVLNHLTKQEKMIQNLKKTMENDGLSYVETQFVLDLIEESK